MARSHGRGEDLYQEEGNEQFQAVYAKGRQWSRQGKAGRSEGEWSSHQGVWRPWDLLSEASPPIHFTDPKTEV